MWQALGALDWRTAPVPSAGDTELSGILPRPGRWPRPCSGGHHAARQSEEGFAPKTRYLAEGACHEDVHPHSHARRRLAAASLTGTHAAEAQSSCNSGTKVLSSIWGQWGERIKAQNCKTSADCLDNTAKKEDLIKEMITFWNAQSQGSWATIGPRPMQVGSGINDGKVIAGLARLWVTQTPFDNEHYLVRVTKQGGGGAKISASRFDGSSCLAASTVTFSKSDKDGTVKTLKIDSAKGYLGTVEVNADGIGAFDYKFTVERVLAPK